MHAKGCLGTELRPDPTCAECQRWAQANEERFDAPTPPARETWRVVLTTPSGTSVVRDGTGKLIADTPSEALATAIAHDHNAVERMREALAAVRDAIDEHAPGRLFDACVTVRTNDGDMAGSVRHQNKLGDWWSPEKCPACKVRAALGVNP